MVICQGEIHHLDNFSKSRRFSSLGVTYWSNLNFSVNCDRLVFYGMEPQNSYNLELDERITESIPEPDSDLFVED